MTSPRSRGSSTATNLVGFAANRIASDAIFILVCHGGVLEAGKRTNMANRFQHVAIVAAILGAAGGDAAAQSVQSYRATRGAIGDSQGVIRVGKYYEDRAVSNCSFYVNCFLTFAQTNSNEQIKITNLSCALTSSNAPIKLSWSGYYSSAVFRARSINFPVSPSVYAKEIFGNGYVYYYNFNMPTNILLGVGTAPYLNFFTMGTAAFKISMDCTITGQIL